MKKNLIVDATYVGWLAELKEKIRSSQLRAALKVNSEMLAMYWDLAKAIVEKQEISDWGDKIITQLADDLSLEFPGKNGFSRTNLFNIRKWFLFYSTSEIVQQPVGLLESQGQVETVQQEAGLFPSWLGVIPWGHHIQIIGHCTSVQEAQFYVQQTAQYNWKRTVLVQHLESQLYQRKGRSQHNFALTLPKAQSELAGELLKSPYSLGFLDLTELASERDLENAILSNIIRFLKELGPSFAFIDRQYHMQVGEKDYYLDLLFYHTKLHCYLVIELKVTEFIPEFAGKLEFYINAIDDQLRTPEDNPTIGLLLCKTADEITVKYSLRSKTKPIGVSTYRHTIPKEWKDELPDVNVLKQQLQKEIILPQKPVDEKMNRIKELVSRIQGNEFRIEKTKEVVQDLYSKVWVPLTVFIELQLKELQPMFHSFHMNVNVNNQFGLATSFNELPDQLDEKTDVYAITLSITLQGFKRAGINAFDIWQDLQIQMEKYKYIIGQDRSRIWDERLYDNQHDTQELKSMAERYVELMLDQIQTKLESLVE